MATETRKPLPPPSGAAKEEFDYQQLRSAISQSVVRVIFPMPARKDPDYPAVFLASYALAEGRMSFLSQRLVDGKKVGFSLRRLVKSYGTLGGQLCLQIVDAGAGIDALEIELITAIEQWRKSPRTAIERGRALALAATDFFGRMETYEGRALALLSNELEGSYRNWGQELLELTKVTPEDMTRASEKYFKFSRADITELLPMEAEPRNYTAAGFGQTFERILGAAAQEARNLGTAAEVRQEAADVPALLGKYAGTEIAPAPYRTSILRGPELQIWEIHSLPLVDIGIFFPGGLEKETPEKSGLTRLLLGVLLRNSSKYGYEERFSALEQWGGRVEPVVCKDFFGYRLRVLAPYAEQALGLMLDVVRNRSFTDQDIEQQMHIQKGEASARSDFMESRLDLAADQLYGAHPYGRDSVNPGPALKDFKTAQLLEWHSAVMDDVLPMVAVIGDTPGTSLATYFAKHYSGSRYKLVKPSVGATAVPKESKTLDVPLVWQGQKGLAISLLGPEGENEETLLIQMAMVALEKRLSGSSWQLPADSRASSWPFGLTIAWKGGRITMGAFCQLNETADLGKVLADGLAAIENRENLENMKNTFESRLRAGAQKRKEMLINLATGFFCQGQFYSVTPLIEKANEVNLEEYQEVVSRYFSQKQQIQIFIGKR